MKKLLVALLALFECATCFAIDTSDIYLKGPKDAVFAVVEKSLREEMSGGGFSKPDRGTGFQVQFNSFFTGPSTVRVFVSPVAKTVTVEPDVFRLVFGWQTARNDGALVHIRPLRNQLVKQASTAGIEVLAEQEAATYKSLNVISGECLAALAADAELSAIARKFPLSGAKPTMLQLASDDIASDSEKGLIALWSDKREKCLDVYRAGASYFPNDDSVALFQSVTDSINLLIVELYKGRISYGEFAKRRSEVSTQADVKAAEKYKETLAAKARDADLEQQRAIQRASVEAQQQANSIRLMQAATPPPVQSKSITCNSSSFGNNVQTTCN